MLVPASISPWKSRLRIRSFSASVRPKRDMNASSSRLNASRSTGRQSAAQSLFSRCPRRDRRRSKMLVSGMAPVTCCPIPSLAAPNLIGHVDAELQLGFLLLHRQVVAVVGAREAALRRDAEILHRHELGGRLDAALERVLRLELRQLGADQAEHDLLALRHEAQGLEAAGALVVILEEEAVDIETVEYAVGDEV